MAADTYVRYATIIKQHIIVTLHKFNLSYKYKINSVVAINMHYFVFKLIESK